MFAYLSQLRIQRAKEMLRNTKLPVDDIALKIGYESERALQRLLVSMSVWRQNNTESNNYFGQGK